MWFSQRVQVPSTALLEEAEDLCGFQLFLLSQKS